MNGYLIFAIIIILAVTTAVAFWLGLCAKKVAFKNNGAPQSPNVSIAAWVMPINRKQHKPEGDIPIQQIETEGGAAITGVVDTGSGDLIGRDQNIIGDIVQGPKVIYPPTKRRIPLQRPPRAEHFVDREAPLAELVADLQPGHVTTLCGPGGIGKTALAAEAVWQLAPADKPPAHFPDGILFHSFYNRRQASLALEHIAHSFGEEIQSTPQEAAQRALAGRQALLVLDGAEEADDLPSILNLRDRCGVLVTSRRRGNAGAERQDIEPLPLDAAVTLLQAWGGARASDETAVRHISELVGRLPLAIRLVGRYLSENDENAVDYLAWLEETPLAALNQGQRQLDSVPLLLARSLAQVSEQARQVLVIVGMLALAPFEREAIAASLELSSAETMHLLGELVSYGLLSRDEQDYEVSHALIHTYARQMLTPTVDTVTKLAKYYTTFVNEHREQFTQLNRVRPHTLALLRACRNYSALDVALKLAWAIQGYLALQGYATDRMIVCDTGVAIAQALQEPSEESKWLGNLGWAYRDIGQAQQAITYYQRALTIAQDIGDRRNEGTWLGSLGNAYRDLGQVQQAIEYYQQALVIAKESGDRHNEGAWLGNLGNASHDLGNMQQAIEYYQQSLTIAQDIGDYRAKGYRLGSLGSVYRHLGQVEQAIAHYQQALAIAKDRGDRRNEGAWLGNLGKVYYSLGQIDQSIMYYQQALVIAKEISDRRNEGIWLGNLGKVYRHLGQVDQAIAYYQQALAIAKEISDRHNEGTWLGNLGLVYISLKQVQRAIEYYQQALNIAREVSDRHNESAWLVDLGNAYRKLGQIQQAIEYYQQSLAIVEDIGHYGGKGNRLGNIGSAYRDLGQMQQAIECYQQAIAIAQEISDRRNEGIWLDKLGLVYAKLGQVQQAKQFGEQALHIFGEIKSPRATEVHKWLESLK